jgi:hypothetical protein
MKPLWRPAPWHLARPTTAPPKRAPEFIVTGLPCPDCACPAWPGSTATDQEIRWFGRLFTAGSDDLYLLMCGGCGGTITAPSAQVNQVNFPAPSSPAADEGIGVENAQTLHR